MPRVKIRPGDECSMDGCAGQVVGRGLCKKHYGRLWKNGDPNIRGSARAEHGALMKWILDHASYSGDDCLTWPFPLHPDGRARSGRLNGPRVMCELVKGPPPSPKHEAAHSCGKAHEGCLNPCHLSWKTRAENQADRYVHKRKPKTFRYKLTREQAAEIRSLKDKKRTCELAEMYGVSRGNIRQILTGQIWR